MVWSSFGSNDIMKVLNTLRLHHLHRLVSLCAFGSRLCHPLVNVISQVARSQIDIDLVLCKSLSAIESKRCPCEFRSESNNKTFDRRCGFFGDVVRHMIWICVCSLERQIQARRPASNHARKSGVYYTLISCNRLAKFELVLDAVFFFRMKDRSHVVVVGKRSLSAVEPPSSRSAAHDPAFHNHTLFFTMS